MSEQKRYVRVFEEALQWDPNDAEAHFYYGCYLEEDEEYEKAFEMFKRAEEINDQYAEAIFKVAQIAHTMNLIDESKQLLNNKELIAQYEKAMKFSVTVSISHYNLAIVHAQLKNYQVAYEYLESIEKPHEAALKLKARMLYNIKKYEEAATIQERLDKRDGHIIDELRMFAMAGELSTVKKTELMNQLNSRETKEITKVYLKLIAERKRYQDNLVKEGKEDYFKLALQSARTEQTYYFGKALSLAGLYEDSIPYYQEALEHGERAINYGDLAYSYLQVEEYDKAIDNIKKAIEKDSENDIYYNTLGNIHLKNGTYSEVIEVFKKALEYTENDNDRADYYGKIGYAQSMLEQYTASIESYKKAVSLGDSTRQEYFISCIGNILFTQKNYQESIAEYEKVLVLNPLKRETLERIGQAYRSLNMYSKSIEYFQKALQIKPGFDSRANNMIGVNLYSLNRFREAIPYFEKAIEINSDIALYYSNLADAYKQTKEFGKSIENYERAVKLDDSQHGMKLKLGNAYLLAKRYEDSINLYTDELDREGLKDVDKRNYFIQLAEAYRKNGQLREAIENYKKASNIPGYHNLDVFNSLASILEKDKQYSESLKYYSYIYSNLDGRTKEAGKYKEKIAEIKQKIVETREEIGEVSNEERTK